MRAADIDNDTDDVNFAPGTLCKMVASRASFDKTDPEQGLFFVNIDAAQTAVRITTYSRTGSRYIDFLIPVAIPPGTYQVELRTKAESGDIRTALYDKILHIG